MDTELDKTKLVQSKKAGERKAVKKAYEEVGGTVGLRLGLRLRLGLGPKIRDRLQRRRVLGNGDQRSKL